MMTPLSPATGTERATGARRGREEKGSERWRLAGGLGQLIVAVHLLLIVIEICHCHNREGHGVYGAPRSDNPLR